MNDFASGEAFTTSTPGYLAFITWDNTSLYLGVQGTDIAANSSTKWVLVYLGGAAGTTNGFPYNNQQPQLPFLAKYHFRWRTDSFISARVFNGTAWVDPGTGSGNFVRTGSFLEWRIPFANIGAPSEFGVHISMINEAGGTEWSYAAVPSNSFVDGYDPDYSKYFHFDLSSASAPNSYPPLP